MRVTVLAALAAVGLTLAGCTSDAAHRPVDTVGKVPFATRLAIPPLAPSHVDTDGARVFDLTVQRGRHTFRPGTTTPTMGYNDSYLGPTLRATRGERVRVRVRNALDEVTTVHWHGMHLPAAADGGPHQPIDPGGDWNPSWRIDQPAATLWYHPHPHGSTEAQVAAGLAGLFLLDDQQEAKLGLPNAYGIDDLPLIVQDLALDDRGDRRTRRSGEIGTLGDTVAVNGTVGGSFEVTTRLVRLRLVNASTARTYRFALSDARPMLQIASDGGLLGSPYATAAVTLSPGERAEVVLRFAPQDRVVLRSVPFDLGARKRAGELGMDDSFDLVQFHAGASLASTGRVPDRLAPVDRIDPGIAVTHRSFELEGHKINDEKMDAGRIDLRVTLGTTEVWTVRNGNGNRPHNFHIHGVRFQILDINGGPPTPDLAGWKDTVLLPPDATARLVLRFGDYADPGTPYMYHCHLLWHEDQGMMGQFVVVAPGQAGSAPGPAHHHGR